MTRLRCLVLNRTETVLDSNTSVVSHHISNEWESTHERRIKIPYWYTKTTSMKIDFFLSSALNISIYELNYLKEMKSKHGYYRSSYITSDTIY